MVEALANVMAELLAAAAELLATAWGRYAKNRRKKEGVPD
jgi:hypothetical protein